MKAPTKKQIQELTAKGWDGAVSAKFYEKNGHCTWDILIGITKAEAEPLLGQFTSRIGKGPAQRDAKKRGSRR